MNTNDPAVRSPAELRVPPEQVVSYQTSHLPSPPPDDRFESGGDVVREQGSQPKKGDRGQKKQDGEQDKKDDDSKQDDNDKQGKGQSKQEVQGHKDRNGKDDRPRGRNQDDQRDDDRRRKKKRNHQQAGSQPNWKTLVMTAILALVCGVGGAWGYSAFFGSS
ncbi:MAG TPA: hypothetical protein PK867_17685, partial [Pirellulales bacterium]|nr:hypothetical protein [Pirellulales bacterium]